jgi:DNA-binding CsgD family transcriptional regulator
MSLRINTNVEAFNAHRNLVHTSSMVARSMERLSSELRVLALVAEGGSTEETAEVLSISPHTVRTHMRNVMRKLEASSRAHAVAIAMREAAIEV